MTRKNLVNKGTSSVDLDDRKVAGFVSLSVLFYQNSGAIYLRSKSYLVVEISSDVVTEHCCQVCVLSMMLCRSDCRPCAYIVRDCVIRKLEHRVVWLHSDRPTWEMIWTILSTFEFRFTAGEIAKIWCQALDIYLSLSLSLSICIYIKRAGDNRQH